MRVSGGRLQGMTKPSERRQLLELLGRKLPGQTCEMQEPPALARSEPHVSLRSPLQHLKHAVLSPHVFQGHLAGARLAGKHQGPHLLQGGAFTSTCSLNLDSRSQRSASKQGRFFPQQVLLCRLDTWFHLPCPWLPFVLVSELAF